MKHWTEADFLDWLYAGRADDAGHLDECTACRERAAEMIETRRRAVAEREVLWEFLAAQRRAIYRRLGDSGQHSFAMRWAVAAVSLLGIVVLSLTLMHPRTGNSTLYTSADEKLFSDLVSIEQSNEPRAIRPMHHLFQE